MRLILAILAILALATPAAASQADVDVINDLFATAYEARMTGDLDGFTAGVDELYAAMGDAKAGCHAYIGVGLVVLTLIDLDMRYPGTGLFDWIGPGVSQLIAVKANDCLLAI